MSADASPGAWGVVLGPVRSLLVVAAMLQLVSAVAAVVPFVATAEIVRLLVVGAAPAARAWPLAAIALGAVVLRFLTGSAASGVAHLADARMQLSLRRRLAARLRALPLGWFTTRHSGTVKTVLQDDVEAVHFLVAHALLDVVAAVAGSLAALVYLLALDPRLAGLALLPVLAYLAAHRAKLRIAGTAMNGLGAAMGRLGAAVVEFVQGIVVVKSYGRARRAHDRFTTAADEYVVAFGSAVGPILRIDAVASAVVSPVVVLLVIAVPGAMLTGLSAAGVADLLAALVVGLALSAPITKLSFFEQNLRAASSAARSIRDMLATAALPEPDDPQVPDGNAVELRDVHFAYTEGTPAVSGISARLDPGTVTALVGVSGSGKSTLATLLARFHDVDAGAVLIGGVDVRRIAPDELYRRVGFVLQDPYLLEASVAGNIALADPGADPARIRAAAVRARIHERIEALPRGYDSVVGVDALLSGGEAQRVAVARALLADTPVLVLDEATAHADPESEAAIQDGLSGLVAGRTVLVIAHRLPTVVDADRILVLAGGRLVEQGTHDTLLAAGGEYSRMWRTYEDTGVQEVGT